MPAIYEFHVTGLIGPVVEAALPDLTSLPAPKHCVLTGTADEPMDVQTLLAKLTDHGLVADHIVIAPSTRWRDSTPLDSNDFGVDLGADDSENYSAPRQS